MGIKWQLKRRHGGADQQGASRNEASAARLLSKLRRAVGFATRLHLLILACLPPARDPSERFGSWARVSIDCESCRAASLPCCCVAVSLAHFAEPCRDTTHLILSVYSAALLRLLTGFADAIIC
jgi:hypothetical protein